MAASVVARALQRADEPAEMLGYWFTTHGRNLPMPVKRGVADAVRRLYTERAALRYDGLSRQIRMADVIELTHPSPRDQAQSALFRYLLDRRHHDDAVADPAVLPMLAAAAALDAVPADERRSHAAPARRRPRSPQAGFSWERLSGWLPGGMDAEAWEAVIPSMGVMALVRNLRNFDQAGIGDAAVDAVDRQDHRRATRWRRRGCSRTRCGRRTGTRRPTTGSARSAARSTTRWRTSRRSTAPSS